jgi:hypothetical protein
MVPRLSLRGFNRALARFNEWFAGAAAAANAQQQGRTIDAAEVKLVLGEIEKTKRSDEEGDSSTRSG